LENGGGSVIKGDSTDAGVVIVADNTDVNAILSNVTGIEAEILDVFNDPDTWGDAAIEYLPQKRELLVLRSLVQV
jgi:hypothetical protein